MPGDLMNHDHDIQQHDGEGTILDQSCRQARLCFSLCTATVTTHPLWLKAVDPRHQESISVFILRQIERRRPDTEIRVRTPRNSTIWYRLLPKTIIIHSGSGAREQESGAREKSAEARQEKAGRVEEIHRGRKVKSTMRACSALERDQQEDKTARMELWQSRSRR